MKGKSVGKWIRRVVMLILLGIFLFSGISILRILHQYKVSDRLYEGIANQYTSQTSDGAGKGQQDAADGAAGAEAGAGAETAPIVVDFEGLRSVNGDVTGWIYCEDTPINYPVVHGADNDYYLTHNYDGTASASGSIFVEAENRPDFVDSNTIIYGHHMKNGSMFASLDQWADQAYYEEHPVMWLLTPEQDYKIILTGGYTTSATSDTYTIFQGPGEELNTYLDKCMAQSDFSAGVELDGEARYVLLSTCAYVFDNARYVLHGILVPVDSAGGIPF